MPGDPVTIPGTARPAIAGCSRSTFAMRSAGTCPSTTYFPTFAVWQDASCRGTVKSVMTSSRLSVSCTTTVYPATRRWSTHFAQHPQVGLLYTVTVVAADAGPGSSERPPTPTTLATAIATTK